MTHVAKASKFLWWHHPRCVIQYWHTLSVKMSVVKQPYLQIVEEIYKMFRPFSGWAIIRLKLEYRRKLTYYNVDIKNGERDLVLQCLGRCVAIYT
jgi:hypothetical protein